MKGSSSIRVNWRDSRALFFVAYGRNNMFNLDQSIAEWRRQMLAAGVKTPNVLDELESHLRDDIEQQMRLGAGGQEAFERAVQRIGQPVALRHEFAKAGGIKWIWLRRFKLAVSRLLGFPLPCPHA